MERLFPLLLVVLGGIGMTAAPAECDECVDAERLASAYAWMDSTATAWEAQTGMTRHELVKLTKQEAVQLGLLAEQEAICTGDCEFWLMAVCEQVVGPPQNHCYDFSEHKTPDRCLRPYWVERE